MIALAILLAAPPGESLYENYRARTAAETRCLPSRDTTDITVCGRRAADRFRVPLVISDPTDRRNEAVPMERERLLHRTNPVQDLSTFLVGGGMAGVSTTVGGSGKVHVVGQRKLAP